MAERRAAPVQVSETECSRFTCWSFNRAKPKHLLKLQALKSNQRFAKSNNLTPLLAFPSAGQGLGVRQESGKEVVGEGKTRDGGVWGGRVGTTWHREPGSCVCSICSSQEMPSVRQAAIAPSLRDHLYLNGPPLKVSAPSIKVNNTWLYQGALRTFEP